MCRRLAVLGPPVALARCLQRHQAVLSAWTINGPAANVAALPAPRAEPTAAAAAKVVVVGRREEEGEGVGRDDEEGLSVDVAAQRLGAARGEVAAAVAEQLKGGESKAVSQPPSPRVERAVAARKTAADQGAKAARAMLQRPEQARLESLRKPLLHVSRDVAQAAGLQANADGTIAFPANEALQLAAATEKEAKEEEEGGGGEKKEGGDGEEAAFSSLVQAVARHCSLANQLALGEAAACQAAAPQLELLASQASSSLAATTAGGADAPPALLAPSASRSLGELSAGLARSARSLSPLFLAAERKAEAAGQALEAAARVLAWRCSALLNQRLSELAAKQDQLAPQRERAEALLGRATALQRSLQRLGPLQQRYVGRLEQLEDLQDDELICKMKLSKALKKRGDATKEKAALEQATAKLLALSSSEGSRRELQRTRSGMKRVRKFYTASCFLCDAIVVVGLGWMFADFLCQALKLFAELVLQFPELDMFYGTPAQGLAVRDYHQDFTGMTLPSPPPLSLFRVFAFSKQIVCLLFFRWRFHLQSR